MAVWMVRCGRHGEQESLALKNDLAVIGWDDMPDLADVASSKAMRELITKIHPNKTTSWVSNAVGQLWAFRGRMEVGDLVVLPLKTRSALAMGKVTGPYQYQPDFEVGARHTRPVKWIRDDIPRTDLGQDLLNSLMALSTVCRISRNKAEERLRGMLSGGKDPNLSQPITDHPESEPESDEDGAALDLDQIAQNQIVNAINAKFQGHQLTRLVEAVLRAQGYQTFRSPEGPDGGIDILAGRGAMGFNPPRLCVQVKSVASPVDVSPVRELEGVMTRVGAEQGLFVSWSGFKRSVDREMRHLFFKVRLWDSADLVEALLANYENLSDDIQAELPLKRIWTLVHEE